MSDHPTARSEVTDANIAAVETAGVAASDRALLAAAVERYAQSNEAFAAAVKAQVEQAVADAKAQAKRAEILADEAKLARDAEAKRTKRRSVLQALALGAIIVALILGGWEGHAYISASNHRSTVNSGILKRIQDVDAQTLKTNQSIADYTTGAKAVAGAAALKQELRCLNAHVDHDVLGTPTPAVCTALGIG